MVIKGLMPARWHVPFISDLMRRKQEDRVQDQSELCGLSYAVRTCLKKQRVG